MDRTVIFETVHGSRAYGLAGPDSDLDRRGIFVASPEAHLGFREWPEQVEAEPERVLWDVRKLFRLGMACNPTAIESLFTESSDHLEVSPEGRLLLEHRRDFLSRRAAESFGRYGLSQLHRIETHRRWLLRPPAGAPARKDFGLPERALLPKEQLGAAEAMVADGRLEDADLSANFIEVMQRERRYRAARNEWQQFQQWQKNRNEARAELERRFGYDTKHASHLVRLLRMATEILARGEVRVRRPDAEELRAIRQGALSYEELLARAKTLGEEIEKLRAGSALPEKPDEAALDRLCVEIVSGAHRRVWGTG